MAANMMAPQSMVTTTANKGDSQAISREGMGRASRRSIVHLFRLPETAHPLPDQVSGSLFGCHHRRQTARGHDHNAICQLEQFIEFFGNHENSTTALAQLDEFGAYAGGSTDIYPPGRLGNEQDLRRPNDSTPDNILLQIAAGQTHGRRIRTSCPNREPLDHVTGKLT